MEERMNQFVKFRREFHKFPEYGGRELRTSARIAEYLTSLGYDCLMGPDVVCTASVQPAVRPSAQEVSEARQRAVARLL